MKLFLVVVAIFLNVGGWAAEKTDYWLIQQDFIKMGKREIYEKQKAIQLKKQSYQVIGISDLENPACLFLMPIKKLSDLERYPPFKNPVKDNVLASCINFQIFSLHELLRKSSLRPEETFLESRPYYFYVIYETEQEAGSDLEEIMTKRASSQKMGDSWCFWKALLGGEYPKYIFCTSFATKEEMKEWSMETMLDEPGLKNVLRDKKTGWMKRQNEFCLP